MSSWADDIDGEEQPQTFTDAKGITTHIEYRINDDGKKVKVFQTLFFQSEKHRTAHRTVRAQCIMDLKGTILNSDSDAVVLMNGGEVDGGARQKQDVN
jgi:hypothetical protein